MHSNPQQPENFFPIIVYLDIRLIHLHGAEKKASRAQVAVKKRFIASWSKVKGREYDEETSFDATWKVVTRKLGAKKSDQKMGD